MEKRAAAGPEGAPGARAPLAVVCLGEWAARGRAGWEGLEPELRWLPRPGTLGLPKREPPTTAEPQARSWGDEKAGLGFLGEAGVFLSPYSPACLS